MVKTIAVWGNSGSGKSTISCALAWQLVKEKKNVIVINTSGETPMLPVYLPNLNTDDDGLASLGDFLTKSTMENFNGKMHLHPQSKNLAFMALSSGETSFTYPLADKKKLLNFLKKAQTLPVNYIIIDCQSNPAFDVLTLLGLETADEVIRLVTPDVKGIEFCKSQCGWLSQSINVNTDRHIKVANPCNAFCAVEDVGNAIGGFDFILPENNETYVNFASGGKFGESTSAQGIKFDTEMQKLCDKVKEIENENQL